MNAAVKHALNPSENIDALIARLADWRGETLATIRNTILQADPEIVEEWKWMGSPVWSREGIIAVATVLKAKVKLTFSHGASLPDRDRLFNATLKGNTWRAIDFSEGDKVNDLALRNLVCAAIDYNLVKTKAAARTQPKTRKHEKR